MITRYYFGGAYETAGTAWKKYYAFAGQTVAMRDASGFKYFLSDHLGSTSVVMSATGTVLEQQRYLPFGQARVMPPYASVTSTDFTYTGQRNLEGTGLMDYRARFYSPALGRFIQPDNIIPGAANPQSWNRYSYVKNNPVAYNDPTGHREELGNMGNQKNVNCKKYGQYCTNGKPKSQKELAEMQNPPKLPTPAKPGPENPCVGTPPYKPAFTCGRVVTEPADITPSIVQDIVIDEDEFTGFGPEDPPTVNGQTFTPAYGPRQRGLAYLDLFLMAFEFAYYNTPAYSAATDSHAQALIPLVHHNASGMNIIPGVAILNATGMNLHVGYVSVNNAPARFAQTTIPDDSIGLVRFENAVWQPTMGISVVINFQVTQGDGIMFGYGQIRYNGPNYFSP